MQPYPGFDLKVETKISAMGSKGITSKSSSFIQYPKFENDDKKMNELFHIRVTMKHVKVDTLFHIWYEVNLISKYIVKKLGVKH